VSFFRKHIVKIGIILLIQIGFLICLSPTQQRHQNTRNFANWLNSYVKGKAGDPVKKKVENLGSVSGEISQLMVRASQIISKNADHFNMPLKKGKSTQKDVYKLLLVEWNIYHQSTTTGNALSVEHTKNQVFFNSDKGPHNIRFVKDIPSTNHRILKNIELPENGIHKISHITVPLSSGIAIGAP
jgi:hypothetical protein